MIPEIVSRWDKNKNKLKHYFENTEKDKYSDYKTIVKKIFELVINDEEANSWENYDIGKITEIDNGDYQGTLLYFIPKITYQPSVGDYLYTSVYYGSCSGCDTLQAIMGWEDGVPNEKQVSEYMELALHIIQKMKKLTDEE